MHEAIRVGDEGLVSSLVEQGASINDTPLHLRDHYTHLRDTPLHVATGKGSVEITLLLLLREGADIDGIGPMRETTLHHAVHRMLQDVVQVLMRAGASTMIRNFF